MVNPVFFACLALVIVAASEGVLLGGAREARIVYEIQRQVRHAGSARLEKLTNSDGAKNDGKAERRDGWG